MPDLEEKIILFDRHDYLLAAGTLAISVGLCAIAISDAKAATNYEKHGIGLPAPHHHKTFGKKVPRAR